MFFEAEQSYFKQLLGNFINLLYTLALRHQHYQYLHATARISWLSQSRPGRVSQLVTTSHVTNLQHFNYLSVSSTLKWVSTNNLKMATLYVCICISLTQLFQQKCFDTLNPNNWCGTTKLQHLSMLYYYELDFATYVNLASTIFTLIN